MRTGGVVIILVALTALWLYNTGRLEAILGVIKDPSFQSPRTQDVVGLGTVPRGGTTGDPTLDSILGGVFGTGIPSTPPITGTGSGDWLQTAAGIFAEVAPFFA